MKKYMTDIKLIELIPKILINQSYGLILYNGNIYVLYFSQENNIINNKFININMNYDYKIEYIKNNNNTNNFSVINYCISM